MQSLLFEHPHNDVCIEVGKSLEHLKQHLSPKGNPGQKYPHAFQEIMKTWGIFLLLDSVLLLSKIIKMSLRMLCLLILSPDTGQTETWGSPANTELDKEN